MSLDFYIGNCQNLFKKVKSNTVDMIFADPQYNVSKKYYILSDDLPKKNILMT